MSLTQEQLAARKKGIGASDIAAIAGLNPWKTALGVYLDKIRDEPFEMNEQQALGHKLEAFIASECAARLQPIAMMTSDTHFHPDRPWQFATPDRVLSFAESMELLEIKNVGYRTVDHWGDEGEGPDGVPPYYEAQVQWQLDVMGFEQGYVGALLGGREIRIYEVPRNEEKLKVLRGVGHHFWHEYVLPRRPPPPGKDKPKAYLKDLEKLWPYPVEPEVGHIEADKELSALLARYKELRDEADKLEEQVDLLKAQIAWRMGGAQKALDFDKGLEARYPLIRGGVSYKALVWDLIKEGKIPKNKLDRYRNPPYRRLTVKEAKRDA